MLEGYEALKMACNRLEKEFDKEAKKYLRRTGVKFLRKLKKETPVKTGYLRRSWGMESQKNKVIIGTNVKYAPYVEHGHRKRGGKGFVEGRHMLSKTIEEIEKDLDESFEIMLDNLWK